EIVPALIAGDSLQRVSGIPHARGVPAVAALLLHAALVLLQGPFLAGELGGEGLGHSVVVGDGLLGRQRVASPSAARGEQPDRAQHPAAIRPRRAAGPLSTPCPGPLHALPAAVVRNPCGWAARGPVTRYRA